MPIFISYSSEDQEFVDGLHEALQAVHIPVWLDRRRLYPGHDWWKEIENAVPASTALLLVMTPEARESRWVKRELLLAEKHDKPIFPILRRGSPWARIAETQYVDMQQWNAGDPLPDALLQPLRALFPEREEPAAATMEDDAVDDAVNEEPKHNDGSGEQPISKGPRIRTETILALIGVIIAGLALLFGDNLLERLSGTPEATALVQQATATDTPTATLTGTPSTPAVLTATLTDTPSTPAVLTATDTPTATLTGTPTATHTPTDGTARLPAATASALATIADVDEALRAWQAALGSATSPALERMATAQMDYLSQLSMRVLSRTDVCLNVNDDDIAAVAQDFQYDGSAYLIPVISADSIDLVRDVLPRLPEDFFVDEVGYATKASALGNNYVVLILGDSSGMSEAGCSAEQDESDSAGQ